MQKESDTKEITIKEITIKEITIKELCSWIEMPESVTERIEEMDRELDYGKVEEALEMLLHEATRKEGLARLRKALGKDADGMKMLTCMLHCAIGSYEEYKKQGISRNIYIATMKCFSRFVGEHMVSYGHYGFDRDFWTPRQIALKLFRIGELEYELWEWKGEKAIAIHIPSDAGFIPENVSWSLREAASFMEKYYPDYAHVPYTCDSWLLSPKLKEMLAPDSNIIQFQERFYIEEIRWEAMDVLEWVFKNPKCPLEELPEETSLQRKMKAVLIGGENIGVAFGVLQ